MYRLNKKNFKLRFIKKKKVFEQVLERRLRYLYCYAILLVVNGVIRSSGIFLRPDIGLSAPEYSEHWLMNSSHFCSYTHGFSLTK